MLVARVATIALLPFLWLSSGGNAIVRKVATVNEMRKALFLEDEPDTILIPGSYQSKEPTKNEEAYRHL
jgi:hypothetical protein